MDLKGLLIVGCGKMGGAVLRGCLKNGLKAEDVRVVEPSAEIRAALSEEGIKAAETPDAFAGFSPEVVFSAVKPFKIADVVDSFKPFTDKGAVLLTIVAGKPLSFYEARLGAAAIVRAMPNTPAAVGEGITGAVASKSVTARQKQAVETILRACGEVVWVDDEAKIDGITAVSGSGPAYVFYLTEALAAAAEKLGFDKESAEKLAKATVCGSAALMKQSADSPARLRENVTTPNGTTAAALEILMNDAKGFVPLMTEAVKAAERRSKELGKA